MLTNFLGFQSGRLYTCKLGPDSKVDAYSYKYGCILTPGLGGGVLARDILGGFQLVSFVLELI